jgi:hypothetical protein
VCHGSTPNIIHGGSVPGNRLALLANNNMAAFQGVNKGSNLTVSTEMFTAFATYADKNGYNSWSYKGGNFTLIPRQIVSLERDEREIKINIIDEYRVGNYAYAWYINGSLISNTGSSFTLPLMRTEDYTITVVSHDGTHYGAGTIFIDKTIQGVKFIREGTVLSAIVVGDTKFVRRCTCYMEMV